MNVHRLALWIALVLAPAAASQEKAKDEVGALRASAAQAWQAHDWAAAAKAYAALTAADPDDVAAWHHLGYALHTEGKLDEALLAHRRAADAWPKSPEFSRLGTYNIACVLALQGHKDEALRWLSLAVERGFRSDDFIVHDSDLASLREDERFRKLVASLAAARKKVAIVVHEGVELLDFAGPGEVFAAARLPDGGRAYDVFLVAPAKGTVHSQGFVPIVAEYDVATCPKPDIVVVPGGYTRNLLNDAGFMQWIAETAKSAEVMSVCTGAFVLAKAGLLEGTTATTHHGSVAELHHDYPGIEVLENVRFVDHGKVLTAAGVSAGIDGALQVVRRQLGEEAARQTARYMEYRWEPEQKPAAAGR